MKIVFPPVRPRPSVRRAMMGRRRLRLRNSIMSAMGELSEDKDHLPPSPPRFRNFLSREAQIEAS